MIPCQRELSAGWKAVSESEDTEGSFGCRISEPTDYELVSRFRDQRNKQDIPESFPLKNKMRDMEEFLLYNKGGTAVTVALYVCKGRF